MRGCAGRTQGTEGLRALKQDHGKGGEQGTGAADWTEVAHGWGLRGM